MSNELKVVGEAGAGKLYEVNGFLIPVVSGSGHEMGNQYGELMKESMQQAYDVLVEPGRKSGAISDDDVSKWAARRLCDLFSEKSNLDRGRRQGIRLVA